VKVGISSVLLACLCCDGQICVIDFPTDEQSNQFEVV